MIRNAKASIFTVGWASTKSPTGPEAAISTIIDRITATAITQISLAMPTAVMMLSIENTRLINVIWVTTAAKVVVPGAGLVLVALQVAWVSLVPL